MLHGPALSDLKNIRRPNRQASLLWILQNLCLALLLQEQFTQTWKLCYYPLTSMPAGVQVKHLGLYNSNYVTNFSKTTEVAFLEFQKGQHCNKITPCSSFGMVQVFWRQTILSGLLMWTQAFCMLLLDEDLPECNIREKYTLRTKEQSLVTFTLYSLS